jgi:hypothetical protein
MSSNRPSIFRATSRKASRRTATAGEEQKREIGDDHSSFSDEGEVTQKAFKTPTSNRVSRNQRSAFRRSARKTLTVLMSGNFDPYECPVRDESEQNEAFADQAGLHVRYV